MAKNKYNQAVWSKRIKKNPHYYFKKLVAQLMWIRDFLEKISWVH